MSRILWVLPFFPDSSEALYCRAWGLAPGFLSGQVSCRGSPNGGDFATSKTLLVVHLLCVGCHGVEGLETGDPAQQPAVRGAIPLQ